MKPLLVVDGYNVIGAWSEPEKHGWTMDESRDHLLRMLQDYAGYSGEEVELVFDGYLSDRKNRSVDQYGAVCMVFTMHAETADSYIERRVAQVPKYRQVRVATSDGLEQSQVLSTGAIRMTSRELLRELRQMCTAGYSVHRQDQIQRRNLEDRLPSETRAALEKLRREK